MNSYKCVNCGVAASALYKTYGPSVLKLTKCESCKGVIDKYIEYDPVIVMIDLVLMSKEAQRHIIYNTEFKSYWKLFIILIMLETYGVWRNDSLFNIAINTVCNIKNNSTMNSTYITLPINISVPEPWMSDCKGWAYEEKESLDLFIWEKDFYIQFLSIFTVSLARVLKSFSLANMSLLFTLPMLVWGNSDTPPATRLLHYLMVFVYSFIFFYNTFRVLYESPKIVTAVVLTISYCIKYLTTFHMTPFIRKITR
ncbi:protein ARV1 isoform X2 [Vanessa atalanta]|uniref:protein ARV1 isoform X2 n=1 Tax=Vanessa atalanta TaxID=42275 RepID=UPI001FCD254F|nr:protein ARV1 isoform X2 [Vanessa atalanta]